MIRRSRPGDEDALQALWQLVFGDPPAVTKTFFQTLYRPGDAIIWDADGTVASAMYLLDAGISTGADGQRLTTSYAYALATLPSFRGRGLGSQVAAACLARSRELGFDCNVVCPAETSLFPFYERLGYGQVLSIAEGEIVRDFSSVENFTFSVMSTAFSTYCQHRHALLPDSATMYTPDFFDYTQQSFEASGGGLFRLELSDRVACAAVERRGAQLIVREILPAACATDGAQALLAHFGAESAVFRTVSDHSTVSQRPFALVAGDFAGYFPFVLD